MVGVMSFSLAVTFSLTGHSNPNPRSLSGCKVRTLPGAWTVPLRTRNGVRELGMGFIFLKQKLERGTVVTRNSVNFLSKPKVRQTPDAQADAVSWSVVQ